MFNDSLYKNSEVEIKLMMDMDEYLMMENGIRGGMTMILGKVGPEEIPDIQNIAPDAEIGYMLKVDIETPINLHDFFADYPLVPKKQIVSENWLSLYNERLVYDKALYMKYGLKITKIHSALKFRQSLDGVMYYKLKNNVVFGKQMENVRKHMRVEYFDLVRTKN
ncbi:1812_t:CDS:2 [Acaulospora morrowiae]|uniref:1812_t:CDS:1 n=1 Tax=Acaulospora morrowiae TaxID=94023 RepID=A0A9N8YWT9_9GLOM|nr:1812_t:CDS:2 [Acaulospora morrowiae]